MPSSFPNSIDNFTDPLATSPLNSPSHSLQHSNLNDAVEKIETYMGLVLLQSITVGTGVTSVTVSNAFNSAYENYKIIYSGGAASSSCDIVMFLGAVTSGFYGFFVYGSYGSPAVNGYNVVDAGSFPYFGGADPYYCFGSVDVFQPFISDDTMITNNAWNGSGSNFGWCNARYAGNTSFTEFKIAPTSGTLTGGKIRVYGYGKG